MEAAFAVGSIVSARGREWIVVSNGGDLVQLKPITGTDSETTGLFLPLEGRDVRAAQFEPPNPKLVGDPAGSLALFEASRLLLRNSAAPFRCAGRLAFPPRPYQFVPLIMAMRLNPVRLLIADDVGVGKTIEAGMIARELLDRGVARRLLVLCPAHLCDQWETELRDKFGIAPAVVQPANFTRLERNLPRRDLSVYQYYPAMVASIDFVKSDRHRPFLLQSCPDLVIVDEAHLATRPRGTSAGERAEQQRYELLRKIADRADVNLVLVTATPHSGIEENFRSLLGLLDASFDIDPARADVAPSRNKLLPYIVQRRRRDVEKWLGSDTPFPERDAIEQPYKLSNTYRALFEDVLEYCRESTQPDRFKPPQQRVRHWAAIALLRCVLSSPGAAIAVLSNREQRLREKAQTTGAESAELANGDSDEVYGQQTLDGFARESVVDYAPTAALDDAVALLGAAERGKLGDFKRRASEIGGTAADTKLAKVHEVLRGLLKDHYRPIVFCRFIDTANYIAEALRPKLEGEFPGLHIVAVTGESGDEERREKIDELARYEPRVLVATDCLSEGINLQQHFDAVIHYDLPWNPNRLEQREGRVDRFGQPRPKVRTILIYGNDNPVDLVVLNVLINKAREIRRRLGVAVPIPADGEHIAETVVANVLLRGRESLQAPLPFTTPETSRLHEEWNRAAERQEKDRAFFSQEGIKPEEVSREVEATDRVLGDAAAVRRFMLDVMHRFNGRIEEERRKPGVFSLTPGQLEPHLEPLIGREQFPLKVVFDAMKDPDAVYLGRTSPIVEESCHAVLREAFSADADGNFKRAGAHFSDAVDRRTAIFLLRIRYLLREKQELFAEEVTLAPLVEQSGKIALLEPFEEKARTLLSAPLSRANMPPTDRSNHVEWALRLAGKNRDSFAPVVESRKREIEAAHNRLRGMLKQTKLEVIPYEPDVLGCYVIVPSGLR